MAVFNYRLALLICNLALDLGLSSVPLFTTQILAKQVPAVFILVAVHAQVFPVRAVRGIVPVVPVFMVHSQQVSIFIVELSTTFSAYKSVNTQRAFSIVAGRRNVLPQFSDDLINGLAFTRLFRPSRFAPASVRPAHAAYPPAESGGNFFIFNYATAIHEIFELESYGHSPSAVGFVEPFIELLAQPAFEPISRLWHQKSKPCQIGNKTGCQQYNACHENQHGIQHFLCREVSTIQAVPDFGHGFDALEPGQGSPEKSCQNYDENSIEGANLRADFDEQVDFYKRNKSKGEE